MGRVVITLHNIFPNAWIQYIEEHVMYESKSAVLNNGLYMDY